MASPNGIYKCALCGNIVEVIHAGGGQLDCCGQPMNEMKEHADGEGNEKHIPAVERTEFGVKVSVGSIAHPMEEAHFIEWIELLLDGKGIRIELKPGEAPEAEFDCGSMETDDIVVRAYCNVHGLWVKKGW